MLNLMVQSVKRFWVHLRRDPFLVLRYAFRKIGLEVMRSKDVDPFLVMGRLVTNSSPVILDVGANVGQSARNFRSLFPGATIHSFEPFPESYETLCSSLRGDARSQAHKMALSDSSGSAPFNVNRNRATNSLLHSDPQATRFRGNNLQTEIQINVSTQTVDAFCQEQNIPRIEILKLDVQGGEYAVLQGARSMLSDQRIDLIYMELITGPAYIGQRGFHEYLTLLDSYKYRLFGIYNWFHCQGWLFQTDLVVVSANFLDRYEKLIAPLPKKDVC
jgi:FkbM family methyltransferase